MRILKLNRKGKILCNLLLICISVFLMALFQDFPVHSYEALLQRAAEVYLIEEPVEPLYADTENQIVYGMVDGKLLRVGHGKNLFGMQWNNINLYPEESRYLLEYDDVANVDDAVFVQLSGLLIGRLEGVASAELEVTLREFESDREEVKVLTAVKETPVCFRFTPVLAEEIDAMKLKRGPAILRLYDQNGELLEEHSYEYLTFINP